MYLIPTLYECFKQHSLTCSFSLANLRQVTQSYILNVWFYMV